MTTALAVAFGPVARALAPLVVGLIRWAAKHWHDATEDARDERFERRRQERALAARKKGLEDARREHLRQQKVTQRRGEMSPTPVPILGVSDAETPPEPVDRDEWGEQD